MTKEATQPKEVTEEETAQVEAEIKEAVEASEQAEQVDINELTQVQKYAMILNLVRQNGPLFFTGSDPDAFGLDQNDPLRLVWTSLASSWKMAAIILAQFEQNVRAQQQAEAAKTEGGVVLPNKGDVDAAESSRAHDGADDGEV